MHVVHVHYNECLYLADFLTFCYRLIRHTKCLLEEKEDSLCIKVLQTLREMMTVDNEYGEKVSTYYVIQYIKIIESWILTRFLLEIILCAVLQCL